MFSVTWLFVGALVGMLLVSVFVPPKRNNAQLPVPFSSSVFHTGTGCVKFKSVEVPCVGKTSSLNFVASQHNANHKVAAQPAEH
jgi:hypothetical protein